MCVCTYVFMCDIYNIYNKDARIYIICIFSTEEFAQYPTFHRNYVQFNMYNSAQGQRNRTTNLLPLHICIILYTSCIQCVVCQFTYRLTQRLMKYNKHRVYWQCT